MNQPKFLQSQHSRKLTQVRYVFINSILYSIFTFPQKSSKIKLLPSIPEDSNKLITTKFDNLAPADHNLFKVQRLRIAKMDQKTKMFISRGSLVMKFNSF